MRARPRAAGRSDRCDPHSSRRRKELLHILRDAGTLRIVIALPVMQLILFGFIDQTVHDVSTVVVDQDRSTDSRPLMDELRGDEDVSITAAHDEPRAPRARRSAPGGRASAW